MTHGQPATPGKGGRAERFCQGVLAQWPLWLVLGLAAGLRLVFLDQMELWWDEFVTLGRSLPDVPRLLSGLMYQSPSPVSTDCSPPLHHLLVHAALQFGRAGSIIRLPSVVFGLIGIFCCMRLTERLFGRRAAVVGGLFCAVSLFHVYYSRDIRWYAVYYGCSLLTLYALYRAVTEDRWMFWIAFGVGSACSLYASYVAAPVLAGEGLFLAGLFVLHWIRGRRAEARRLAWRALAALVLALVLYAPWIPGQYYAFLSFYGKGTSNPFVLSEFLRNLRFFLEYFYPAGWNRLLLALPLVLVGFGWGLAGSRRLGVWLVLAWGVPPVMAAYWMKTEFSVSPKYIMTVFYLLTFGLAFGAEALARAAARLVPRGKAVAGWTVALGLVAVAGASNLNYPAFYQGKMYSNKAVFRQVALDKNNVDAIFYETERNHSFMGDWYLGDLFRRATERLGRDYKRYYLISDAQTGFFPWTIPHDKNQVCAVGLGSVANRAPLLVTPDSTGVFRYGDDFRDLTVFKDAWSTDNVTTHLLEGGLVPADMSRPGLAVYAFALAPGQRVREARVRIEALCLKRNVFFPDASVTVLAGADPDHLARVGEVTALSPPGPADSGPTFRGYYTVRDQWSLPADALAGQTLYVALAVSDGTREGMVRPSDFRLEVSCQGVSPDATAAMRHEWASLLANLSERERPQGGDAVTPGRLAAFSRDPQVFAPDAAHGLGGEADRQRFLADHPGLAPVHVIRAPSGAPVLELYDPWLGHPSVTLAGDAKEPLDVGPAPIGYKVPGGMSQTLASFAGQPLPLSCGLPAAAVSTYATSGESFILARELFDQDHFDPRDIDSLRDIRVKPEAAAMTCLGKGPCQATYRFQSLYPLTRLVLTTFPHIFCDPAGKNFVRLSMAADGGPFTEVYALRSDRSERWQGTGSHPHVDAVPLAKGTKEILVRLEMANDGSMWHSSPDAAMTFELYMNASGMPPLAGGTGELANLSPDGRPASVFFLETGPRAFEALRPGLTVTPFWRPFFR